MAVLGIVGALSIAIGGTLLTIMLLAANSANSSPIPFVSAVFLGFLLIGFGLWFIAQDANQKTKPLKKSEITLGA
jgi:hypothetical protein